MDLLLTHICVGMLLSLRKFLAEFYIYLGYLLTGIALNPIICSSGTYLLDGITVGVGDGVRCHMQVRWVETTPLSRTHMVKFIKSLPQVDDRIGIIEDWRHISHSISHAKKPL